MRKSRTVIFAVMAMLFGSGALVWALTFQVKYPNPAKVLRVKVAGVIDEAGNVLFGATNPGKVEVTNLSQPVAALQVISLALPTNPYTLNPNSALGFGSGEDTTNCRSLEAFVTASSGDPGGLDANLALRIDPSAGGVVSVVGSKLGAALSVQAWAFLVPGTSVPVVGPNAILGLTNPPAGDPVTLTAADFVCVR